jgi:hypothetical protein
VRVEGGTIYLGTYNSGIELHETVGEITTDKKNKQLFEITEIQFCSGQWRNLDSKPL